MQKYITSRQRGVQILTPSKSATECVWVYTQSGSEKCVVQLLNFCLSKLPSNQPQQFMWDLWLKYLWIVWNPGITEVTLKSSILPKLSEMAGLDHSTKCLQKLSLKSNSVHKSLNALHAYEQTSVCKKKQLVSVYIWESSMKKHMIVSKRRSLLLQNARGPEGFHSASIFWTPKLYI